MRELELAIAWRYLRSRRGSRLLSLISVITGVPVRHDVALTGEMSLHGVVLPVGGLREKLLAALRSGLRTVIVPARNSEDVLQLPREVRQRLEIRLVEHVSEVFAWALVDARTSGGPQPAPAAPPKTQSRRTRREKRRKGA